MPDLIGNEPLLVLDRVTKVFGARRIVPPRKSAVRPAVADVSLTLDAGETVALVGESGSGKTTVGRLAMNLLRPDAGAVRFAGLDHRHRAPRQQRALRRRMQMVFQDTRGALDPLWSIGAQLREPLDIHGIGTGAERGDRVAEAMRRVGLDLDLLGRRPGALSGGQRQRVVIARAMILDPELVVCDEPVSALDLSVQARIMALLKRLQTETRTAFLFISHDLRVVRRLAHRVAVMQGGRIVEIGPTEATYRHPKYPYTRRLLAAAGFTAAAATGHDAREAVTAP